MQKKKKDKKWYDIAYFNCDCFSPEDLLRFFEDKKRKDLMMELSLMQYDGIIKRTFKAIKYIFGGEIRYTNVFILHRLEVKEFKKFLLKHCNYKKPAISSDEFIIADNGEHIIEFEFDTEYPFLNINLIFSDGDWLDRIRKGWQHIKGMRCKYGVWDEWKMNDKKMSKMIYLADKVIKAEKKLKNKK